ncbi:AmpD protein [Alteromonadaceae bacterium Bs31]|nr:AmpD protein [Alteromonadaceae bacterium Bs31]
MIEHGWYSKARKVLSPNYNTRPHTGDISLLVIHNISLPPGEFGGDFVERFFLNSLPASEHPYFEQISELQVSAHCFIRRDGELVQFVPFDKRAWHAGRSVFQGREDCNDFSVGIELEGTDTEPYTEQQYQGLAELTLSLLQAFPLITPERIVGHSDIAPSRKTDPGPAFDWGKYRSLL